MRSKRDVVDYSRHGKGTGDATITPEPSRGPAEEEWAWMVDKDPAFYLTKSGRAQESTGR